MPVITLLIMHNSTQYVINTQGMHCYLSRKFHDDSILDLHESYISQWHIYWGIILNLGCNELIT